MYLNSNDGSGLLAFGEGQRFVMDASEGLEELQLFIDQNKGKYIFGYLSYEMKDQIYGLSSQYSDLVQFPLAFFWVPEKVVRLEDDNFDFVQGQKSVESLEHVQRFLAKGVEKNSQHYAFDFQSRITQEEYIQTIIKLKEHIQQGNIYEVNFCQEFFAENVQISSTADAYFKLNALTKAPFSAYLEFDDLAILCGSPERFLKKTNTQLVSQPIKGTAPRGTTVEMDEVLKNNLENDPKERSENVMIVDLVRNDLSRIATVNSVNVDELCKIYSFETVHQMISTISCDVRPDVDFTTIIKATFPMGSMTGAPKLRAMELIEEFEAFKRGVYSGAMGYIAPNGDFDLNVVIRTLLYNRTQQVLSCSVGGAITIQSDPEKEYQECLVKVKRILDGMNE